MDNDSDCSVVSLNDISPQEAVTNSFMPCAASEIDNDSFNYNQRTNAASGAGNQPQVRFVSAEKSRYSKPQRKRKRRHRNSRKQKRKDARDFQNVINNTAHKNNIAKTNGNRKVIPGPEQHTDILPRFDKTKKMKCGLGKIILNYSGHIDYEEEERIKSIAVKILENERKMAKEVQMINKMKKKSEKIDKKSRQRKDRPVNAKQSLSLCCIC